jgi:hypothetical protein
MSAAGANLMWLRIPAYACLAYGFMFTFLFRSEGNLPFGLLFIVAGLAILGSSFVVDRQRERAGASDKERARRAIGSLYITLYYGRGERDLPPSVLGWLEEAALQRERIVAAGRHPKWEKREEAREAMTGADQAMERIFAIAEPTISPTARNALGFRATEPAPFVPPKAGEIPLPPAAEAMVPLVSILRSVADEMEASVRSTAEVPPQLIEALATLRARRDAEQDILRNER